MEYLMDNIQLGENLTFDQFFQIIGQSREEMYWFRPSVAIPLVLLYILIMLFGLVANGLICYIIAKRKKLQTVRNMFIMNLAVSDMIMCLFCMPFTLMRLLMKNWPLGEIMCHLVPWLQGLNIFASVMTITAIALDRYQVIVYPTHVAESQRKWAAYFTIAVIWLASAVSGLPLLIYSSVQVTEETLFVRQTICFESWPSQSSKTAYTVILLVLMFLIPVVVLVTIHWRISSFLKRRILLNPATPMELNRAMKEASRHRKNSTLLMSIAVMFALCWFPLTLLNFLADFNRELFKSRNFLLAFAIAHLIAMISACLNPIMYGWFNSNFRHEFTSLVCFGKKTAAFGFEKEHMEGQRVIFTKPFSYKAIQTDVQPVLKQYTLTSGDLHLKGSSGSLPGQR